MRKTREIADHLHFRMTRNGQVIVHYHTANAIDRSAEAVPDVGRVVARRPNLDATWDVFVAHVQSVFGQVRGVDARPDFDSEIVQLFHRADLQILRVGSEHAWLAFNQNDTRLRWSDVANVFRQRVQG